MEPTGATKKQNAIRERNQEKPVGLILTVCRVSSVVFQLKFLYYSKPRRRREHTGSSEMRGEESRAEGGGEQGRIISIGEREGTAMKPTQHITLQT